MNWLRLTKGFLLSLVFLFLFGYIISGVQYDFGNYLSSHKKALLSADVSGEFQNAPAQIPTAPAANVSQPLPPPEINAESAISVESNLSDVNKTIFEKDSDTKLPIASLTKLMTAVIVLDNYDLSENITADKYADSQDSMKQDIKLGDTMPIESFLEIMLVESSNKSAYALAEKVGEPAFVGLMNQKAKEIGLENTFYADPTGLSSENVSTASDLTKLAEYILTNYPRIADISRAKEFYVPGFGEVQNTDELLGEIPEIVCSKTGFTTQAK
ncbi:MAG: serine hydrolase, partial [Candidatus Staskawiczbacteria bacterium]